MVSRWFRDQESNDSTLRAKAQLIKEPRPPSIDDGASSLMSLGGWQMHRAIDCRCQRLEGLQSGESAELWLQKYRLDPFGMNAMRMVLVEEGLSFPQSRLRDQDVIEQVSNLLKGGIWHVCEPVMRVYRVAASSEPAFIPVPNCGPISQSSAPQPEIPDQPTLSGKADQAAIASVLTEASQDGSPICEECLKAAASRVANAVVPIGT
jgi:hypothetical protein